MNHLFEANNNEQDQQPTDAISKEVNFFKKKKINPANLHNNVVLNFSAFNAVYFEFVDSVCHQDSTSS